MSDLKDPEKGFHKSEEKIALTNAEASNEATDDHEKLAANGGDTVKIADPKQNQADFCGLSKEELQKFANDPFWRKVRLILFIAFWVAWVGMLLAAILIIVVAPKCPERPKLQWWQKSLFYRVCPRTFKDSNGDGSGDFKGLESKINYIHDDVHSNAIVLTPIFQSTYKDLGFDVTNVTNLNDVFGTEEELKSLIKKAHRKDVKVVLDFVVNNVDKNSDWWKNEDHSKFVWRKNAQSNLKTLYDKDSWQEKKGEFFYSTLSPDHLDLDLTNEDVFSFLEDSMKKWLSLGVDGFRIPHAAYLVESNSTITENNRVLSEATFTILKKISNIVKNYEDKVLIADLGNVETTKEQIDKLYESGVNMIDSLNLARQTSTPSLDKIDLFDKIEKTFNLTGSRMPIWNLGNEDTSRFGDNIEFWRIRSMLGLLLRGSSMVYYGNELAVANSKVANEQDKYMERDMYRAPMMWEDTANGGFSDGSPWLEVDTTYMADRCVACQKAAKKTHLQFFQKLAKLRQEPSFQWGLFTLEATKNHKVIAFIRQATGFPGYMVILNTDSKDRATIDLTKENEQLPDLATVEVATENSEQEVGAKLNLKLVGIPAKSGIVLKWEWKDWDKKE